MDPVLTSDGKPYANKRYKQIVEECYYITKFTHNTYGDIMDMSSTERNYLLDFIQRDLKKEQDERKKLKDKMS